MWRTVRRAIWESDPTRLWRRYAIALGLIFVLVCTSYAIFVSLLASTEDDAAVINLSGRQRMLSQRIVLFTALHSDSPTSETAGKLASTIDLFERSHNTLSRNTRLHQSIYALFFNDTQGQPLDEVIGGFIKDARAVLKDPEGAAASRHRVLSLGSDQLLGRLDKVVKAFEDEARRKTAALKRIHLWAFIASLGTLFMEAVLIFLPAHHSATSALKKLKEQHEDIQRAAAKVEYQSLHDPLTGLGNRRYLDSTMNDLARDGERDHQGVAMLHIDLDRFKQINDTLGHAAGDYVLAHVASVMKKIAQPSDILARVGGDEFVLVRQTDGHQGPLKTLAGNLINAISQPVKYENSVCRFGASIGIGIAIKTDRPVDTGKLLINADLALCRAKESGRGQFAFYSDAMEREVTRIKRLSDEILVGIEEEQFLAHYQPQVDAQTHQIVGLETLVRWAHPRDGLLYPEKFLSTAHNLGIMPRIDISMLRQAIRDRKSWQAEGLCVPRLAFNVAMSGLTDSAFLAEAQQISEDSDTIAFELMEAIFFDDCDPAILEVVQQVKSMGFDIEIDDFGTGHASIVSLLTLSPDRLKIDRQLIQPIVDSPSRRKLVESVIEIGRSMNVEVIAEGVETMDHARILGAMGCDILQGYAFGRAMNASATRDLLKNGKVRAVS